MNVELLIRMYDMYTCRMTPYMTTSAEFVKGYGWIARVEVELLVHETL